MKLEDQENSKQRLQTAIEERTAMIKNEMPKSLWGLNLEYIDGQTPIDTLLASVTG